MYNPISEADLLQKKYLDDIDKKKCRLFPEYNLKQILFNETYYAIHNKPLANMLNMLEMLFTNPCTLSYDIKNRKLLTLYTKNYRVDHDGYWDKICNDVGEHDDIKILWKEKNKCKRIAPWMIIKKYKWYKIAMKDLGCIDKYEHRKHMAIRLVERKWTLEEIDKLNLHPKAVMCFFDSAPDENVLMQYFKMRGAVTITNQHGQSVYRSHDYDRMNQSQLLNFKCDYYFAKGQKQKEQLIAAGTIDASKVKIIGNVGDNNKEEYSSFPKKNIVVFGIYLDCPTLDYADRTNKEMIHIVQEIAKKRRYKYFIKIHPADKKNKYKFILDGNSIGVFGKEDDLRETFKLASIAVISASSTYLDAYKYGLRCLKYDSEVCYPIAVEEDCFTNEEELERITDLWFKESDEKKVDYLHRVNYIYNSKWKPGLVKNTVDDIIDAVL